MTRGPGDSSEARSELILYQTEDGRTRIQCRFEGETLWLTQAQMAELFQTTPQNITLHLKDIFAEGELDEGATCKPYLQVRQEGDRGVTRRLRHYNLDDDAQGALAANQGAKQVVADRIGEGAAELDDLAVREDEGGAENVVGSPGLAPGRRPPPGRIQS